MSELIKVESSLAYAESRNPFNSLFLSYEQEIKPTTLEQKTKFLAAIIRAIEECETQTENEGNVNTWLSIASAISGAAVIISAPALAPIAAGLALTVGLTGTAATIGGTLFKVTKENPILDCLKRYKLCLKSTQTADWAAIWQLVGTERFLDSLYEGTTGQIIENRLVRMVPSKNAVVDYLASLKGVSSQELITEIKQIKSGQKVVQEWVEEALGDPRLASLPPVEDGELPVITNTGDYRQTALNVRDHLVINAQNSTLPGCVILAAPGSGKTTFIGSAWLKLKDSYSSNFKSLAIIVKPEDRSTFEAISDRVLNAKTQSRTAAIALIKFVAEGMHQDGVILRLFIDDFLTASKYLNAAVKGYQINLESYAVYPSKKEASEVEDFDTISLKDAYESALNEAWLVGREYNLCLWISSHSSNIEDLSFMGSSTSRSVGDFIFLAKSDKRDFLETALKNDFLIPSSTRRGEIREQLDNLKVESREPILLANYNNWVLGIVPNTVLSEYQSLLNSTQQQPPTITLAPTVIQQEQNIVLQAEDCTPCENSEDLSQELIANRMGLSLEALKVLDKLKTFENPVPIRDIVRKRPFGNSDSKTDKVKYYLDELVIKKLVLTEKDGERLLYSLSQPAE